jgi:hypothetical protein
VPASCCFVDLLWDCTDGDESTSPVRHVNIQILLVIIMR